MDRSHALPPGRAARRQPRREPGRHRYPGQRLQQRAKVSWSTLARDTGTSENRTSEAGYA